MTEDQFTHGFPRSRGVPNWPGLKAADFSPVDQTEFDRLGTNGQLHEVFDSIALKYPDRLAIVGSESLTYLQLRQRSAQAAVGLASLGVKPGDVVCIIARNDWQNIAAMLGALRVGATCNLVASDAISQLANPPIASLSLARTTRIFYLLDDHEKSSAMSLTSLHARSRTSELASLFHGKSNQSPTLSQVASYDFPAFVFFTSGSTGTPQAVSMSHQFILLDIARQINDLAIRPVDRFDLLFSPNFSAFLAPTFGAILTGASLWIRSLDQSIPTDLIDWLIDSEITISTMSVSVMRALFEQLPKGGHWPSLRILSVGAEPLRAKDVLLFHDKTYDQAILQNAMATTETRTYAQYFFDRNQTPNDPIPIGYPVLNRHVEILDDRQGPLSVGQVGHVRISSKLLAAGNHLGGITRFDSSDLGYFDEKGLLYCIGRKDSMVKIRGQKVYLNQIETEILRVKNVSNAFVFTFEATPNNPSIIACIESADPTVQDAVFDHLRKQLPPIAFPSRLSLFEQFPRTSTGKIDRQGLIQSVTQNLKDASSIFSNSDTHIPLCELLASFLAKPIQLATRIDSLGIDSIQSLDLCIRIEKKFSRRINWSDIHSCETCIQLEELIKSAPVCEPLYWVKPPAHERPTLILFTSIAGHLQQFNPLIEHLVKAQLSMQSYGIAVVEAGRLHLQQDEEVSIATFTERLLEPVLDHVKRTPLILAGHSWGGLIAFELACQIQKNGQSIKSLVLIDTIISKGVSSKKLGRWTSRIRNFPNWFLHEAIQMKPDDWIRESVKKLRRLRNPERNDCLAPENSLYDQQYRAACKYQPNNYRGQVTVIRAKAQSLTRPVFGALGWEVFVEPKPNIRVVSGNHLSILDETRSSLVANILLERIAST